MMKNKRLGESAAVRRKLTRSTRNPKRLIERAMKKSSTSSRIPWLRNSNNRLKRSRDKTRESNTKSLKRSRVSRKRNSPTRNRSMSKYSLKLCKRLSERLRRSSRRKRWERLIQLRSRRRLALKLHRKKLKSSMNSKGRHTMHTRRNGNKSSLIRSEDTLRPAHAMMKNRKLFISWLIEWRKHLN